MTPHLFVRSSRVVSGAHVAALALLLAAPAFAQWSSLPGVNNLITTDSTLPREPGMLSDGAGGAFVAWHVTASVSESDLRAQRLDANGTRLWGDTGLSLADVPGIVQDFDLTSDGAGGVFFLWEDERLVSGVATRNLYVQRLNAAGQPQWGASGQLLRSDAAVDRSGAISDLLLADGAGGCYFYSRASNLSASRLHRLTGTGTVATGWPDAGVDVVTFGVPLFMFSDTASATPGEHGVWLLLDSSGGAIIARRVTAAGGLGTAISIPVAGIYDVQSACSDGEGGFFLVIGGNTDLFILRLKSDGTFAWPETNKRVILASGSANNSGAFPHDLIPDGNGGVIATFYGPLGMTDRMRAQRLSATGDRLWGDNGIEVHAPVSGFEAGRSISDGNGGVIISWEHFTAREIRAQRLDGNGTKLWPAAGVLVAQASVGNSIITPYGASQLVTDQAGGAIFNMIVTTGTSTYAFGAKRTTLTGSLGSNSPLARLINISARAQVGSGDGVLIPGFVVSGGTTQLLVRGIGPTLEDYDVTGFVVDPQITLFDATNQSVGTNDDWGLAANAATIATVAQQVSAFALPSDSKDAAMLVTLAPGQYTAVMRGAGTSTGVGLVELYEVGGAGNAGRLANMSVRAQVGTGATILIPGIVVGGSEARTLLIRAIGPTLADYDVTGALANPQIALFNEGGTSLGGNDNWSNPNGVQIAAVGAQVGAFALPGNSNDSAMLITLAPGLYTAQVSGVGGTAGICLVEVYEVP